VLRRQTVADRAVVDLQNLGDIPIERVSERDSSRGFAKFAAETFVEQRAHTIE
jgi:hypothetical protein